MQFRAARCTRMAVTPAWHAGTTSASAATILQRATAPAALSRRSLHTAAVASSSSLRHLSSARPLAAPSARFSSAATRDAEFDDSVSPDTIDLSNSYFPFGSIPPAFPLQGFPLCRVAYGGTSRPGHTSADASADVKSYMRLGGNLVELQRGFSFNMIESFKELIEENKVSGDIVLCASISSADVMAFIDTEEERWNQAKRRTRTNVAPASTPAAPPAPFVSELLPAGVRAPTTPGELLPLLPRILPLYLSHFLTLHELESVDVLLLEPPSINLNADKVPDASFAWMGGVDSSLTLTEEGFLGFTSTWFEALELAQRRGLIKSYGLSSARFTLLPTPAELTPEGAAAAAKSGAGLPPPPPAPHGSKFYVPLDRILDAARAASAKTGPPAQGEEGEGAPQREHHLSTLKFPFSLFNAHKLLYPSTGSSGPSFFDQTRAAGLLCLGDLPLDDAEPRYNEWVRFQECPSQDAKDLLKQYKESMQKLTNLEYVYKLLVEESELPEDALPPRIPDFSWGGLIHTHQNDLYNIVTWEALLHRRIRPTLARSVPRLKSLLGHPKLQDWATRYAQVAPEACKRFQHAVEHTTSLLNEKLNEKLVACVPRLRAFPSLEEKALLILLSTPIHSILTDQTPSMHLFAHSLIQAHHKRIQEGKGNEGQEGANAGSDSATDSGSDRAVTISSALQPFLLSPAELRSALDMLQTEVAPMLPVRVMTDELRKKKPTITR